MRAANRLQKSKVALRTLDIWYNNIETKSSMHICLLSYRGNMYCGGQGIYLYYLSRALVKAGQKVSIITGPPYPDPMPWARVYRIKNENFFTRSYPHFLPAPNPLEILLPLNFFEFATTRVRMFPEMLTFSLRAFRLLRQIRKEEKFDIIHDNQSLGYGLLLVKRLGSPVVATIHHPLAIDRAAALEQARRFSERVKRLVYYPWIMQKLVSQRLDKIITVSYSSATEIEKAFAVNRENIRVVYNGVDTDLFLPRSQYGSPCQLHNRLIFVGNTEDRKKGIIYLLQAMKSLSEKLNLVIINGMISGNGYIHSLIRSFGLEKRVHVAGKVSNSALINYYHASDITVIPSVYEGFGFPAAEAMACGLPVVATRAGALPEVLGNCGCAVLVEPKNHLALAQAIKTVMQDDKLRSQMGEEGRQRVLNNFTWNGAVEKMLRIYQECL